MVTPGGGVVADLSPAAIWYGAAATMGARAGIVSLSLTLPTVVAGEIGRISRESGIRGSVLGVLVVVSSVVDCSVVPSAGSPKLAGASMTGCGLRMSARPLSHSGTA